MNSSQFMDKQIMDLMNPQEENQNNGAGMKKEEILPSYDFQPIRTVGSSPSINSNRDGSRPSWGSADSTIGSSNLRYSGISEPHELANIGHDKERDAYDVATVAEIDRTVKKHADNLLHALEGVSSRLTQLESRTRHLESSVDELKVSIGNSNGNTDGKIRQLANILREVQTGVQVLRDKQEIAETQLQLAKLQAPKGDQLLEKSNTGQPDSRQQPLPSPEQPVQQSLHPPFAPPQPPPLPAPNAPPPPPQQNPPPVQFPAQLTQSQFPSLPSLQRESYFPQPGHSTEDTHQQYQMPTQQPQPPPPQHYQSAPQLPQYPQPSQPPQQPQPINPSPQLQPPLPHRPEESAPYMPPPQTYPPSIRIPAPSTQPPSGLPPPQQFYGPSSGMYEPPSSRPSSGQLSFPAGYGPPSGPSYPDSYPYSGSPSHYSSSTMKPSPFASSAASTGGNNYPRLPTAQILPQESSTGSNSGGNNGNRVPIDDVVDKVSTMGFSRDQVRATVRKLTENGQTVDLNVVLDKLMNDGEIQQRSGWFGR